VARHLIVDFSPDRYWARDQVRKGANSGEVMHLIAKKCVSRKGSGEQASTFSR
jgi:hypothetical protein